MQGLATATLDHALNAGTRAAPEGVQLLPNGYMQGGCGCRFDLANPGGLAFQGNGMDLPVDYQHQNDNDQARLKGPVPAAGWIKELHPREDGIRGRVEGTATAAALIRARIDRMTFNEVAAAVAAHSRPNATSSAAQSMPGGTAPAATPDPEQPRTIHDSLRTPGPFRIQTL